MNKQLFIATGIPGTGKTTLLDAFITSCQSRGVAPLLIDEYRDHMWPWARREENLKWQEPRKPEETFNILREGYVHMNEAVAASVGLEVKKQFERNTQVVAFEIARGVGNPMVGYSEFIGHVARINGGLDGGLGIVHIELTSNFELVKQRLQDRYDADPEHAPPPDIYIKYVNEGEEPNVQAVNELDGMDGRLPIIFNEGIVNNGTRKELIKKVEGDLFSRVFERMGLSSVEGALVRGAERR